MSLHQGQVVREGTAAERGNAKIQCCALKLMFCLCLRLRFHTCFIRNSRISRRSTRTKVRTKPEWRRDLSLQEFYAVDVDPFALKRCHEPGTLLVMRARGDRRLGRSLDSRLRQPPSCAVELARVYLRRLRVSPNRNGKQGADPSA